MQPITLGKYQLLKRIATGGMAEIFVARVSGIPGFEKIVVVKRILPQLASNQEFIQMFLDEARIAATLHHPNIVQMYDIGAVDGNYFISMEYLHGEDIRHLMKALRQKGEGLPLEHALNIIIGMSAGLHYAHEKVGFDGKPLGIVHRDVTPQNVFVTYDGGVKIVDFGIAKASNRAHETRFGTLKGKIPYMSPEQCRSEPLDRRSDIFAIGIMLYELTTGMRLFKGSSEFEVLKKIVEQPIVPPSAVRPGYPAALEAIVLKALAKDKEKRYQTAQELQADLEAFGREHRLVISPIALSAFMQRIFGHKIEAWREAQAGSRDLVEAIAERHELSNGDGASGDRRAADDDSLVGEAAADVGAQEITPEARGQLEAREHETVSLSRPQRIGSRRWLAGTAVLGFVAVGVAALLVGGGRENTSPRAAPAGTASASPGAAMSNGSAAPAIEAAGLAKITTRPEGAKVSIDGRPWPELTPTVVDGLAPGTHEVTIALAGYGTRTLSFTVHANATTPIVVELAPEPRPGGDAPTPTPPPGPIRERDEQKSRDADRDRARDKVNTPVAREGAKSIGELKGAEKGRGKDKDMDSATPATTAPQGEGELRVASTPSCEVIIDGKSRGSTPLVGIKLPAGKHRLQLVNSRFGIDRTYTIEIVANEVTKKKYDFPVQPN